MLTAEKINDGFMGCIHCSQQVVREWADELGYDCDAVMRMAAPFGAGFWRGDNCGAVCGAMMVVGMKYGHSKHGDEAQNAVMIAKTKEFTDKFIAHNGSVICRELVEHDFRQEGELEKAFQNGRIFDFCPKMVQSALEILDEIM